MITHKYKPGDIIEHKGFYGLILKLNREFPLYTVWHFQDGKEIRTNFWPDTGERLVQ